MSDLGFFWDILFPTPSVDKAVGRAPLTVQTALDPNSLDDGLEGISVNWGDGNTEVITTLDWDIRLNHTYVRPGIYHATASSMPAGVSDTKTFIARVMGVKPKDRRTRFVRPH